MPTRTLTIFDFDDTLFTSDAKIGISVGGKKIKSITPGEYASYIAGADETFDYSDFQNYPPNPQPIEKTVSLLRSAVLKNGIDSVFIVTARGTSRPIEVILENFGMPPVEIIAVGSSNPERKADFVESEVKNGDFTEVVLYEDNAKNIAAVKERMKLLGIAFKGFKVVGHGKEANLIPELHNKLKQARKFQNSFARF